MTASMTAPPSGPWTFTAQNEVGGMTLLVEPESYVDGFATFVVHEATIWWNDAYTGDWWSNDSGIIRATQEEDEVYYKMLEGLEWIAPPQVSEGYGHVYNQFTIRTEHREALRTCLAEHGIGSNVYYPLPLHLQPCFAELGGKEGDLPITESLCAEVLSLPIYPELEVDDVVEVCEVIRTFDP